jgi:hypothetical protein
MPIGRRGFIRSAVAAAALGSVRAADSGKLVKVRDLDIFRHPDYYCGPGPSPVVLPDRSILVGFRRSPASTPAHFFPEVEGCLTLSRDGGKTWSEPRVIDFGGVHNVNLTLLADGSLIYATSLVQPITRGAYERVKDLPQNKDRQGRRSVVFTPQDRARALVEGFGAGLYASEYGVCVRRSTDRGQTWSPAFAVSPVPGVAPLLPGFPSPTELRSPVVPLRSGKLVLPVYSFPEERVFLMGSDDGGRSWSLVGRITTPEDGLEFANETVVYETASGALVAFIRTNANLVTRRSTDGGRTWEPLRRHTLWGYPYTTVRMRSGRVLLAYGYRKEPFGIRARLLDAECTRVDEATELVLRDDGGRTDLGYPLAALLPDGTALVAYYFNHRGDGGTQRYIAATVVAEG